LQKMLVGVHANGPTNEQPPEGAVHSITMEHDATLGRPIFGPSVLTPNTAARTVSHKAHQLTAQVPAVQKQL